jgi:ubiquinone/menaquinone biosynthesis C-methylase UbiE
MIGMKTHYAGHDIAYRLRKAEGRAGWDKTADAYARREVALGKVLGGGFAPTSGRLLELGCGAGNISLWFVRQGFEVTGVDISPTAIEWAKERSHAADINAEFLCADVLDLTRTLPDASFDFLLDGHCFHCIIGQDREKFLQQVRRLLKPNGFFLVDTMCGPVQSGSINGYDPVSKCAIVQGIATRYWGDPEEIQKELMDSGFTIVDVSIEYESSHGSIMIQTRKRPNQGVQATR